MLLLLYLVGASFASAQVVIPPPRACVGSPLNPPDVWPCPVPVQPIAECASEDPTWRPDRLHVSFYDFNGGTADPGDVLEYYSVLDHMPQGVWYSVYWWSCLPQGLIHLGVDRLPYSTPPASQAVDLSTSSKVFTRTWYGDLPAENPSWIRGRIQIDPAAQPGDVIKIRWVGGSHPHTQHRWLDVEYTFTVGQTLPPQ
jgi:hypothetical protein